MELKLLQVFFFLFGFTNISGSKLSNIPSDSKVNNTKWELPSTSWVHSEIPPNMQPSDPPRCKVNFHEDHDSVYFTPRKHDGIFIIDDRRPTATIAGSQQNSDEYLVGIFNGTVMPPYVRAECLSLYPMDFNFEGQESLQFFRIWRKRAYLDDRVIHQLSFQILLPRSSSGKYHIHSVGVPALEYQFRIYVDFLTTVPKTEKGSLPEILAKIPGIHKVIKVGDPRYDALEIRKDGAICRGPFWSDVKLIKFSPSNPTEARLLIDCLKERFTPCGLKDHNREEGFQVNRYLSVLTTIPKSGLLACLVNNEIVASEYFTGLDGRTYRDWSEAPPEALLSVKLEPEEKSYSASGGVRRAPYDTLVKIFSAPGVFVSDLRTLFITYTNGSTLKVQELGQNAHPNAVHVTEDMIEIIVNDETFTKPREFNVSTKFDHSEPVCGAGQFACNNGACIDATRVCNRYHDCVDFTDEQNCTSFSTPCPTDRFECANGFCIPDHHVCNNYDDCKDMSDENPKYCTSEEVRPRFINTQSEYIFVKGESTYLNCTIFSPNLRIYRVFWDGYSWEHDRASSSCRENNLCRAILMFPNVTEADAGTYECALEHEFINARMNVTVSVIDSPNCRPGSNRPRPQRPNSKFTCSENGKHPDPKDCKIFHECVANNGTTGFSHFEFTCGPNTVYCQDSQVCEWEENCGCKLERSKIN